jgi:hypothetical protein
MMEFRLKGIAAVVAGVLFVGVALSYRVFLHRDLVSDPEVKIRIENQLASEIAGDIVADAEAVQAAMDRGDFEEATALAEGVSTRRVEVEKLALRGTGEDVIVRATYTVNGPEGPREETGYFRFSHSPAFGWRYERETTAFSWYTKLF